MSDMYNNDVRGPTKYSMISTAWEFGVPVMENFIPASMLWDAIATKHDW